MSDLMRITSEGIELQRLVAESNQSPELDRDKPRHYVGDSRVSNERFYEALCKEISSQAQIIVAKWYLAQKPREGMQPTVGGAITTTPGIKT